MRKTLIYLHRRLDNNEVFYIGIGCLERAFDKYRRSIYWKRIVDKTEYSIEILSDNLTWENAQEAEIQLIKLYGRKNLNKGSLCNLTDGGEGNLNRICSIETKRKLSVINTGNKNSIKNHTEESKLKMSKIHSKKIIDTNTQIIYENRKLYLKYLI